jgi:phosphocarrier protein HPr
MVLPRGIETGSLWSWFPRGELRLLESSFSNAATRIRLGILMYSGQVTVKSENGLHLSPISQIVRMATGFNSTIKLSFDGRHADAKSAFDLMLLAAPCGAVLELEIAGDDAEAAAGAVTGLFSKGFDH